MEKLQQQINLLLTQIETVSFKIETVESVLEKDFNDWSQQEKRKYGIEEEEAIKQLRSEKEQLRSEKKQLRSEKEQLRSEKEQLRRKEEQLRRKEEQQLEQETILMKKEAEGVPMNVDDISSTKPVFTNSKSDQFIRDNHIDLEETADVVKFLRHKMGVLAPYNPAKPYQARFLDNCLEFRLDVRQTKYQLDNKDDIKIQLARSGAGKTRKLLELLFFQFGYYFVTDFQNDDFGSWDMAHCNLYSINAPQKTGYFIELLYFVRVFVCNYLLDLGYVQPQQILLAQLHPLQFFGNASLHLDDQSASDAVRYGIGFCEIDEGIIRTVQIVEVAVIECLRYLTPFSDVVKALASQLLSYPKPQMVGFMLEYLVGYAFVANFHPSAKNQIRTFTGSMKEYLKSENSQHEVFFPDHCCGPDILYKDQGILHIIQVKFVEKISKQERVNACHTTDPNFFYWNKKQNCILKGFQETRSEIMEVIGTYKSYVFLHSTTKTIAGMENTEVINQKTTPLFFDNLSEGMWELLNKIRDNFNR